MIWELGNRVMEIEILARNIQHPEGPDLLPNGDIVFVETWTGKLKVLSVGNLVKNYAQTDGGPNASCVGADGMVYVTQNGGIWHTWRADVLTPAGIQRVSENGKAETIITSVDGVDCSAPNDLCFGADGRLYFTDPGGWHPADTEDATHGPAHIFAVGADGRGEVIAEVGDVYPNGIAARNDGIYWNESHTRLVKHCSIGGKIETLTELPAGHIPDGMKFDDTGKLWITTVTGKTIDILDTETGDLQSIHCPHMPLNCLFVDGGLLVTDGGVINEAVDDLPRSGSLLKVPTTAKGHPLFRGRL